MSETTACAYCGAEEGVDCQSAGRCRWADDAHDSSCPGCPDCNGLRLVTVLREGDPGYWQLSDEARRDIEEIERVTIRW